MKVEIISHTPDALRLLLRTKNTRLAHDDDPGSWPLDKQLEHLAYMKDTIQSSWEFVAFTFEVSGVTRAFTHQFVRTRAGSFAQESQRTVDVREHEIVMPARVAKNEKARRVWESLTAAVMTGYGQMIDAGIPVQDARGILPTNVTTSIIAKFDLRTLHTIALIRLCTRTQGEYQQVFQEMVKAVTAIYPWAEQFLKVQCRWDGTCAFPRYTACPVNPLCSNVAHGYVGSKHQREEQIEAAWQGLRHEAVPVAKAGRTM